MTSNSNFFSRVTVSSASFPTTPSAFFGVQGLPSFSLINEGTGTVEYSFDGSTLAGDLVPGGPTADLVFNNTGHGAVWLRLKSGSTTNIRVEASGGTLEVGGGSATVSGSVNATIVAPLGQKLMAASIPVAISNDQTPVPVQHNGNIGCSINDPLGSNVIADSVSVAIATDQIVSVAGIYNTSAPTLSNGNVGQLQVDVNANLKNVEQYAPVYEDNSAGRALVEQRNSYSNITSQTTTVVKSGAGFLHMITINAATATGVITIYDNTAGSGTKIGTITMPATLLANQVVMRYDVSFATGLTIVTATASQDITVSYR